MLGIVILKSLIIGSLLGAAVAAGAARMFYAPEVQSMGAFRTLGELNACKGDPVAHFSFGLGFFFNSAASVVGAGALTQDVIHRIIPNWSAGLLLLRNRSVEETLYRPAAMAAAGAIVGAVVVTVLNSVSAFIPQSMAVVASEVLGPASSLMMNPVMPVIFWLAALDAGRITGTWATILGGLAHMIMGNAVPGIVLGILIGKAAEERGYTKSTNTMIAIVAVLFILIAYFRGFHLKLIGLF